MGAIGMLVFVLIVICVIYYGCANMNPSDRVRANTTQNVRMSWERSVEMANEKNKRDNVKVFKLIAADEQAVEKMENGALYNEFDQLMWDKLTNCYKSRVNQMMMHNNKKPKPDRNMLPWENEMVIRTNGVYVYNKYDDKPKIYCAEKRIIFWEEMGFQELTVQQTKLLGMALIKSGKYEVAGAIYYDDPTSEYVDTTKIRVKWEFWEKQIQKYIDKEYDKVHAEYLKTHRSIY